MIAYVWTLSIALVAMAGVAFKYYRDAEELAMWIQLNHPEDLT